MKSRFSADLNGNGNGSEDKGEDGLLAKLRKRRISKEVALTKGRKKAAKKDGGGSISARWVTLIEERIGKEIKCKGKDWYLYSEGKWKLVDGGKDRFKPIAWDVQDLASRNPRRTDDLLKSIEQMHQLVEGEEFVGAINKNVMISGKGNYLLNFANCVLRIDIKSGEIVEMLEPKPEYMFTLSLGKYYTGIDCPFFMEKLEQVLDRKEDRELLLDFFASTLLPDSRFQVALFCLGNGSNGKSVITDVLARAIGKDIMCSLTLHQICMNDRKHIYRLDKKLVNVSTETSTRPIEENSLWKMIVSGEQFETDRVYETGFSMQTHVKLCFLMNNPPMFRNGTEAEYRRTRMIQFSNRFDEDNKDSLLGEKLIAESEGILSYLVRRLPGLCKGSEMRKGSYISKRVLENFKFSNDVVSTFFNQCIEKVPNNNLSKPDMYSVFTEFSKEREGNCRLSYDSFFKQIKRLFPTISTGDRLNIAKNVRHYSLRGLQFSDYGFELFIRGRQKLGRNYRKDA